MHITYKSFCVYFLDLIIHNLFVVTATMHGYKKRSTQILLGEEAMSLDFVLEPTIPHQGSSFKSSCYYPTDGDGMGGFPLLEFMPRSQLQVLCVILVTISAFLFFLIMRRVIFRQSKHRQPVLPHRSIA